MLKNPYWALGIWGIILKCVDNRNICGWKLVVIQITNIDPANFFGFDRLWYTTDMLTMMNGEFEVEGWIGMFDQD